MTAQASPFLLSTSWRAACVQVQDEGSQLVALATGAAPGDLVVDLCCGRGGKALALLALLEGQREPNGGSGGFDRETAGAEGADGGDGGTCQMESGPATAMPMLEYGVGDGGAAAAILPRQERAGKRETAREGGRLVCHDVDPRSLADAVRRLKRLGFRPPLATGTRDRRHDDDRAMAAARGAASGDDVATGAKSVAGGRGVADAPLRATSGGRTGEGTAGGGGGCEWVELERLAEGALASPPIRCAVVCSGGGEPQPRPQPALLGVVSSSVSPPSVPPAIIVLGGRGGDVSLAPPPPPPTSGVSADDTTVDATTFADDGACVFVDTARIRRALTSASSSAYCSADGAILSDVVLVDAPCSALGTLRRGPNVRWEIDGASLARYPPVQRALLAAAATLVAVGGVLVYATCTFLPAEVRARGESRCRCAFRCAEPLTRARVEWRPPRS